jgi:hypothetical protein
MNNLNYTLKPWGDLPAEFAREGMLTCWEESNILISKKGTLLNYVDGETTDKLKQFIGEEIIDCEIIKTQN